MNSKAQESTGLNSPVINNQVILAKVLMTIDRGNVSFPFDEM